jgi:hypothetical protein
MIQTSTGHETQPFPEEHLGDRSNGGWQSYGSSAQNGIDPDAGSQGTHGTQPS